MALSSADGPFFTYGNMAQVFASVFGTQVGDPNPDAGPNGEFQGDGFLDCRFHFEKDRAQGYVGRVPIHFSMPYVRSVAAVPQTAGSATIAALSNAVSGTPMALKTAVAAGIAPAVPIIPFNQGGIGNGTPVNVLAIDYGFTTANCVAGNPVVTVASAYDFEIGEPLVIAGVGNAGGTASLLTFVVGFPSTTTITLNDAPLASNATAPVGTGNIWGPSETWTSAQNMRPLAALPWIGQGPGLFLDSRQGIARTVSITGVASGTGGAFTVRGFDIYGMPMSETITVAGGVNTVAGNKAFKYILSVTPGFSDAHNYSVGTTDVFGLHYRTPFWDDLDITWNNAFVAASTGFTAALSLNTTSTATTADVRGTYAVQGAASDGTRRLQMSQTIGMFPATAALPGLFGGAAVPGTPNAYSVFGNAQFTS